MFTVDFFLLVLGNLIGVGIAIAGYYALKRAYRFLQGVWLHIGKWGSIAPDSVKFFSEKPENYLWAGILKGCVIYDIGSGEFVTIKTFNKSDFLVEYGWAEKSIDRMLLPDGKLGYEPNPDYNLEMIFKHLGDRLETCVFVPCKIYVSPMSKVWGIQKHYVELDHLHVCKVDKYFSVASQDRSEAELREQKAIICIRDNDGPIFNGSVDQFVHNFFNVPICNGWDVSFFNDCNEQNIINWCKSSGHTYNITVDGGIC